MSGDVALGNNPIQPLFEGKEEEEQAAGEIGGGLPSNVQLLIKPWQRPQVCRLYYRLNTGFIEASQRLDRALNSACLNRALIQLHRGASLPLLALY